MQATREEIEANLKSVMRWLTKGFWAISDQGLFAASNFVLSVLLARWLTPDDYGVFSTVFAVFILIGVLHTATLSEPMLVFGSGKYKNRLSEYLGVLVYGHVVFAAMGSAILLLASLAFALIHSGSLATVLLTLALAEPFILILWLMRRACYARLEPHLAASGGALYMLIMLAGCFVLYWGGWLSAAAAFGLMGISSAVVSLWLARRLGVKRTPLGRGGLVREAFEDHWAYGRWSTANEALNWVPMNSYYLILPFLSGLAAGAEFKALMNLIMPMLQAIWALSILLLPTLVRARDEARAGERASDAHARFSSRVRLSLAPFLLIPLLYWLLLGLFHRPVVAWLYDGRYVDHSALLWLLGLSPIIASAKQVLGQSLRALERPDRLFWAYVISAVGTLTVGTALVYVWGVAGAGMGFLVSQVLTAALALVFLQRLTRSQFEASRQGADVGHPSGERPPREEGLARDEAEKLA